MPSELQLRRDDLLLGRLRLDDLDQPWFVYSFEATEAFEAIRHLFDEELRIVETPSDDGDFDVDAWEEAYRRIDELGLRLVPVDDQEEIESFILHVRDGEASLRY